jgi:hypothetical protein
MKIEDCEGCIINLKPIEHNCTCSFFHESLRCPCQHCLVKIMCIYDCELFREFSIKSDNLKTEEEKELNHD